MSRFTTERDDTVPFSFQGCICSIFAASQMPDVITTGTVFLAFTRTMKFATMYSHAVKSTAKNISSEGYRRRMKPLAFHYGG